MAATTHSTRSSTIAVQQYALWGLTGAVSGLVAGVIYGALLSSQRMSPMMNPTDLPGDFILHLFLSALVGLGFGVMLNAQTTTAGKSLVWGVVFGVLWWFVGPLTLFPLLHGSQPVWSIAAAQAAFPLLIGLALVFGAVMGLVYWSINIVLQQGTRLWRDRLFLRNIGQGLVSGGVAGLLGGYVFGVWMEQAGFFPLIAGLVNGEAASTGRGLHTLISILIGMSYGVLFQRDTRSTGASIAWGMVYGLIWWILGALTFMPLLLGNGVQWSLASAQAAFPSLVGHLLYGITLGVVQAILSQIWRILFVASDPLTRQLEGPGTRSLRALALGAAASVGGGLVFTLIMVATDALPTVAQLAGMTSPVAGFFVHMSISIAIGASYGLLFQRETTAAHTALGWGLVYGVIWWLLGPLTLMPALLGLPLQWSLEAAANAFPSLIGHLLYGVVLAVGYERLTARYAPRRLQALRATAPGELTATYALWLVVIVLSLILLFVLR